MTIPKPIQFLFVTTCFITGLNAASFDCAKAQSPLEKAICRSPLLSAADEELNAVWRSTIKTFPLPAFLRASQQLWLKNTASCTKSQQGSCVNAFRDRTALLKNLGTAKVYTNYGNKFSLDSVTLVVFEKGTESFLWMYGDWMPDMNNPQPPPFGFLLDDVSRLNKKGDGRYVIEGQDHEVLLKDDRVVFEKPLMVSARQGQVEGTFNRVR